MKTHLLVLLSLTGCYNFETVEEACLDEVKGGSAVTDPLDLEAISRLNCYRRLAKAPAVAVDERVQQAVEDHVLYLETNTPYLNLRAQSSLLPGYTGTTGLDRLEAAGYTLQTNTQLLEYVTQVPNEYIAEIAGGQKHLDFWFASPFVRGEMLQPVMPHAGLATAYYTYEAPEIDPIDLAVTYHNFIYRYASPAIMENPKIYPRNGQLDAPGSYIHLTTRPELEFGQLYGYPITFTVGTTETGLVVDQAGLSGPDGSLPFQLIYGDAFTGVGNTVIMVPDDPMTPGQVYTAFTQITTDQGTRRARSVFTIGADAQSAAITARMLELPKEELPRIEVRHTMVGTPAP